MTYFKIHVRRLKEPPSMSKIRQNVSLLGKAIIDNCISRIKTAPRNFYPDLFSNRLLFAPNPVVFWANQSFTEDWFLEIATNQSFCISVFLEIATPPAEQAFAYFTL